MLAAKKGRIAMAYYLAYGSNLNKGQMKFRCPDAVPVGTTVLKGQKLVFRRGFLTIEPDEGSSVPVGVWRISKDDELALDMYEGYPRFYRKETIPVEFDGSAIHTTVPCLIYIMQEGHPIQQPSDSYFYTVMVGYSNFGIEDRKALYKAYEQAKWPEDEDNE